MKRATLSRRCRKPPGANARSAGRNGSMFTSSSIATTTCFTTNDSIRRPLPFCRDYRKGEPWKKPALPHSRKRPEQTSTGLGRFRSGFMTGLRSAGFVGGKNEGADRKIVSLADRTGRRFVVAPAPRYPAFLGLAIFSHGQGQADGFDKAGAILRKPRHPFSSRPG